MASKAISAERDRLQSAWLVGIVIALLTLPCLICIVLAIHPHDAGLASLKACVLSLTFGLLVWALRAATPGAALCGGMICLLVTFSTASTRNPLRSGLTSLMLLFVLTFAASRAGRLRKEHAGLAESRRGRAASQIVANLGAAALFSWAAIIASAPALGAILMVAALCEATADTVSSEIGQAFGGTPYLVTTLRRVPVGTDGAITLLGTSAGITSALAVAAAGLWSMRMSLSGVAIAFAGGLTGLFFDSLLGATVERRGWLNNDLVNFVSTVFAAVIAWVLLLLTS